MKPSKIKEIMQEAQNQTLSEEGKIYYAIYKTLMERADTHKDRLHYLATLKNLK